MRLSLALLLTAIMPMLAAGNPPPTTANSDRTTSAAESAVCAVAPFAQVKKMGRGVNILGYDPIWSGQGKARFTERHFRRISEGGFQTVRVNLHGLGHMDEQNRLDPAWLATLDWVVQSALTNGLTVILDEHDYNRLGKDAAGLSPKLLAFWQQVAERYRGAPADVLFEILNEPNGQLTVPLWHSLLKDALATIRKSNPTRNVVIGPAGWNSVAGLQSLEVPADDRHIIVTVHYYLPMEFTHQGARWNKQTAALSGIPWGSDAEKRRVEQDFVRVQQWSKAAGRPR
jgi:endoglucanase